MCDVTKFEELLMDVDSFYLASSKHDSYDWFRAAMKKKSALCKMETVRMNFQPTQQELSSLVFAALSISGTIDKDAELIKEKFCCTEMICLCSETHCCYDIQSSNSKLAAKALKKRLKAKSSQFQLIISKTKSTSV